MRCRHRRDADRSPIERIRRAQAPSASAQAAVDAQRAELKIDLRNEDIAFEQRRSTVLNRRPIRYAWCAAQSSPEHGSYHFCAWLTAPTCDYLQCAEAESGCVRCETGAGGCARDSPPITSSAPLLAYDAGSPKESVSDARGAPHPAAAHSPGPAAGDNFRLSLGPAADLVTRPQSLKVSMGTGSFQLGYELEPAGYEPVIAGRGLRQTYLLFGGPGSGKTTLFRHILIGLLGHPDRPGCLLLDPKGVLSEWLARVMAYHHRSNDLTVLAAGRDEHAFNVLGETKTNDSASSSGLPPKELGRLLSEVVLAGATVDPSWTPLLGDLLESSAVVLSAHVPGGQLTANSWLRQLLTTEVNSYSGEKRVDIPIVVTARRVRNHPDPDVQLASQRIEEFYRTVEDKHLRYLRQMIERSFGELMSAEWQYLSRQDNPAVYGGIIREGRVVSVAVGQGSPAFQRSLSTLTKAVFQQAVLADLAQRPGETPFCILACDEYAQAITEGETGLVSDSRFFSLSREAGCLSLLALQSVATGRSRFPPTMRDRWEGILGNVTVKFFMRLNDIETAELGSALAGTRHSFVPVSSTGLAASGSSLNEGVTMIEHRSIPAWYLTNKMPQGRSLVHGTLDGESEPTACFISTPYPLLVPETAPPS